MISFLPVCSRLPNLRSFSLCLIHCARMWQRANDLASKKRGLFIGSKKIAHHIGKKVIFIPNRRAFIILKRKLQVGGSRAVPSSACPASSRQERTCQQFGAAKGASPCCLQGRDSRLLCDGQRKEQTEFCALIPKWCSYSFWSEEHIAELNH